MGEHTFGVLCVLTTIYHAPSPALLRAALYHDAPEALLGDMPSPAKTEHPELAYAYDRAEDKIAREYELNEILTEFEEKLLTYADLMDLAMFSLEECDDGNLKMVSVFHRAIGGVKRKGLIDVTPAGKDLYDLVLTTFESRGYNGQRSSHSRPE